MPAVVVTWLDAHSIHEFQEEDDMGVQHKARVVQSVGWLFRHDETGVTIAGCYDDEGIYDRHLFVPAGMVLSVQKIGRGPSPNPTQA